VALCTEFVAAQEVALGEDADEVGGLVHHEQAGDLAGQHEIDGFLHRRVRGDGNAVGIHDVGDDHLVRPSNSRAGYTRLAEP